MRTRKRKNKRILKTLFLIILFVGLVGSFLSTKGIIPTNYNVMAFFSNNDFKMTKNQKKLPAIKSTNVLLLNLKSNEVIASKKADERAYPASVTKIMTAYLVTEKLTDLNQMVEIPQATYDRLLEVGASTAGFYANEWVPAKDLLYGLMLPSGAEATVSLAIQVAGSEEAFVTLMNQTAAELGMTNTNFTNSTGLHNDNHYTTATDLAKLLAVALKNPVFRDIFTTKESTYVSDYHPEGLLLDSRLFSKIESSKLTNGELLGGKTGYTDQAGQCLATLASVEGTEYILITLGAAGNHETDIFHIEDGINIYQSL